MEISALKRLSTSMRLCCRSVYHAPHMICRCSFVQDPLCPLRVSVSLSFLTVSLLFRPVHHYSDKLSSRHYRNPACPPIVTLRETIFYLISRHFRNSMGEIFSHCRLGNAGHFNFNMHFIPHKVTFLWKHLDSNYISSGN